MFSLFNGLPFEFFGHPAYPTDLIGSPRRILLVEDDPVYRSLLWTLVNSVAASSDIEMVRTGEAARNRLDEDPRYSLVIADYLLDGSLTGTELWDLCKIQWPRVPFLLISGKTEDEVFAGLDADEPKPTFLFKPFPAQTTRRLIHSLLDGGSGP